MSAQLADLPGASGNGKDAPLPAIRVLRALSERWEANGFFRAVLLRPWRGIPESKIVVKEGY